MDLIKTINTNFVFVAPSRTQELKIKKKNCFLFPNRCRFTEFKKIYVKITNNTKKLRCVYYMFFCSYPLSVKNWFVSPNYP